MPWVLRPVPLGSHELIDAESNLLCANPSNEATMTTSPEGRKVGDVRIETEVTTIPGL